MLHIYQQVRNISEILGPHFQNDTETKCNVNHGQVKIWAWQVKEREGALTLVGSLLNIANPNRVI